jgi:hypothetical protein
MKRGRKPERIPKGCETLERLLGEKKIQRASSFTAKPKPMRKRKVGGKGWVDVAKALWDDPQNDHCCEVCGVWLGEDFSPAFYHHLLHRGSYRKMARRPDNLAQVCLFDHDAAHAHGVENLAQGGEYRPGWMILATRMIKLRDESNGIHQE